MELQDAVEIIDAYNIAAEKAYTQMRDAYGHSFDQILTLFRNRALAPGEIDSLQRYIRANVITWPDIRISGK